MASRCICPTLDKDKPVFTATLQPAHSCPKDTFPNEPSRATHTAHSSVPDPIGRFDANISMGGAGPRGGGVGGGKKPFNPKPLDWSLFAQRRSRFTWSWFTWTMSTALFLPGDTFVLNAWPLACV
eukprot:3426477-Prymnesium_polylepis.2